MKVALFIGRFQPFHKGHLEVVKEILKENDSVIIAIGSAENSFLPENPMTASERFQIIDESLKEAKISSEKYRIIPIRNINNYNLWVEHLNTYIPPYETVYTGSKIVKDCYADKKIKIKNLTRKLEISATKIREAMQENKEWEEYVPKACADLMKKWKIPERTKIIQNSSL
ncbi:nicotinamide-nucleotide adenylyltransferase [Candidatus Gracilibacteria bacterium]|jgi:nicotinamide-nucleotide adenylyltransferase|nr:nicotinamide-nucleotide adenylyltransferase [Candidatus Gracilibacteria bacterium]